MAAELVASKMAEIFLSEAVQRISDLLIQEADSLSSVKDDVESFRTELTRIKCFLEDAEHKQEQDNRVRNWVSEVRDLACEIEDVVETFVYKVHFSRFKFFHLRELRTRINSIKDKLLSIGEARQRYQIEFSTGSSSSRNEGAGNRRRSYPDEDEDFIALTQTAMDLKLLLLKEEDRRCVVSIVGMGGIGKTTLAKKVYNDCDVKKHFDCFAWVFMSQQFVPRKVLEEILIQVGFSSPDEVAHGLGKNGKFSKEFLEERRCNREILKGLEDHELVDFARDGLKEKRYLVVLDDIWRDEAWCSIQSAFPEGKQGSKILFTTRNEALAASADPQSPVIKPRLLTPKESWELLKCKVFPRGSRNCSLELEELGKEIVRKSGGLPLAIIVLGGLLRTKNHSLDEWKKVLNNVMINNLKLEQRYRVQDVLELSFHDLPFCLKPCFLYLASFPEDSEINKQNLIRLWIAEGFVPAVEQDNRKEGMLMEDVGEQYLDELISRCMVHVSRKDHTGKGVQSCRLHDLMRDFCISKAKEEIFLDSMHLKELNNKYNASTKTRSRRLSIHGNNNSLGFDSLSLEQVHPHLRSLLCSAPISSFSEKNFSLLRVLELDFRPGRQVTKLPKGTGDLIHLRYLKVSGGRGRLKLPESIGHLRNLQTLDVRGNWGVTLPSSISKLIRLRHLLLPYSYSLPFWAFGASFLKESLRNMVTLKCIRAEHLITRKNVVLDLSNIRDLGVRYFRSDEEVSLFLKSLSSHSQLSHIRSLRMHLSEGEFPNLEFLLSCRTLTWLCLHGSLPASNLSSCLPKSLTKLELFGCNLNQLKMAAIEKHRNLRVLRIAYDYSLGESGDKFLCSVGGFPKLEILTLDRLHGLEDWEVEEGSLPNLRRLEIQYIPRLRMIPEGLKYVTALRELNVSWMNREFMNRIRRNKFGFEGKDYYKVCHIPTISLSNARRW